MDKQQTILAAMAAGGNQAKYDPIKIQKLLFLIDKEVGHLIGGEKFEFKPCGYGPFDNNVYDVLRELAVDGYVEEIYVGNFRQFMLSQSGFKMGRNCLKDCPNNVAKVFFKKAAEWVLNLNFQQIVSAIYQSYPEIKKIVSFSYDNSSSI